MKRFLAFSILKENKLDDPIQKSTNYHARNVMRIDQSDCYRMAEAMQRQVSLMETGLVKVDLTEINQCNCSRNLVGKEYVRKWVEECNKLVEKFTEEAAREFESDVAAIETGRTLIELERQSVTQSALDCTEMYSFMHLYASMAMTSNTDMQKYRFMIKNTKCYKRNPGRVDEFFQNTPILDDLIAALQ
jgi:hypothetical protein